jgi:hypothetical protein
MKQHLPALSLLLLLLACSTDYGAGASSGTSDAAPSLVDTRKSYLNIAEPATVSIGGFMGWWKVDGSEQVIGDQPLDALSDSVRQVIIAYQAEFGREPSRKEWELMLTAALATRDEGGPLLDVERVSLHLRKT